MSFLRLPPRTVLLSIALALALAAAYANHFQNEFHFDDFHTITTNVYIGELRNIPRFFTDATTFSTEPSTRTWRPLTSTSLAIDYWLGRGFKPFWFHLSTFLWYTAEAILLFFLYRKIMDRADPLPSNLWTALFAAACYGLHPANAETVNYIIQRGDLYCTLGVVAGLLWFIAAPAQRKYGWYLLPAVAAYCSKAPALIFPFILTAYVLMFERPAWRATLPAWAVTIAAAILTSAMTPATFVAAGSAMLYRLTQPWVMLHYFHMFFLPTGLTADSDQGYIAPMSGEAMAGYLFVVLMLAIAYRTARSLELRPIAFGIVWFFLALAPTSLLPLADVTNDHRMFFPFVGLTLAVVWSLRLVLDRPAYRRAVLAGMALVLAAEAVGTHTRNAVWRSEESLWQDVTIKSPKNGRGWLNYASALMDRRDFAGALPILLRAETLVPQYDILHTNLAVTYGNLGNEAEAVRHFERAIALSPGSANPHLFYGRWLKEHGRWAEAQRELEAAVRINSLDFPARYLLMQVYSEQGNRQGLDQLVDETLKLAYNDEVARRYQAERAKRRQEAPKEGSPASLVQQAAQDCRAGRYQDCVTETKQAIALKPDFAEAYNVMAMGLIATQRGDEGIEALRKAVQLKPDFEVAKRNLAWALEERRKALGR